MFIEIPPIPCQHIADYYNWLWLNHHCIAWNLLRRGYGQCASGRIEAGFNNLYEES
jgi:hypothetical protein